MILKKGPGEKAFDYINIIFMLFMIAVTLYPFIHVLAGSLSESKRLIGYEGVLLFPRGFSIEAYRLVAKNPNILSGYRNTLFILVVGTSINLFLTSLGAYVLSRKQFAIKRVMMILIVFTMYFSGGMIPRYLLVNNVLNLKNSLMALILPGAIMSWNLIVMRTNFCSIPDSLEESGKLDGANDITILFRIILPLSKAVVAVMILFYGVYHWNAWFDAVIFLRERKLYPLQLILREILITNSTEVMTTGVAEFDRNMVAESIKFASIIVATAPILLVYPSIQKYFVKGVMIGALKG